jgi:hypothetical protein
MVWNSSGAASNIISPTIPDSRCGCELGLRHDNLFRSIKAGRRKGRQLDPDHARRRARS